MSEVPRIKVLESLNPVNSGTGEDVLAYNGLAEAVELYRLTNPERSNEVWDSELGSLDELSKARQLASEYLLKTALKVVGSNVANRDLWAGRFTLATSELYGEPEKVEATRLIVEEYTLLSQLQECSGISQQPLQRLLATYEPIIIDTKPIETEQQEAQTALEHEKQAIAKYGEAIKDKYLPLFDLVDKANKEKFSPSDLQELFSQALDWLKENDDPKWSEWSVEVKDGASLSISAYKRKIEIAYRREAASIKDTKGLIAHELLVHALRAKNGYKTDDDKLATGLPGYLDAEEGLGVLTEAAINGEIPDKAYDRYIDIALALGVVDGIQRTRQELFQISYSRQLIRAELRGDTSILSSLVPRVWGHIDRIYRGGPGDNIGTRQAVFTKDIAYYVGYRQMASYITEQLDNHKTALEVLAYLSQAKFDPTNDQHLKRLAEVSNK
ncbi:MAG: tyrosine/phenylalanine carboxypeptidase domain-containing protein [Candidatus Saccharimonadales bacterium]